VDDKQRASLVDERDQLLASAQKAEAEIAEITASVGPLAKEWVETLMGLRTLVWNFSPTEDLLLVDLPIVNAYWQLFDKLADLAELSDPFVAISDETELG